MTAVGARLRLPPIPRPRRRPPPKSVATSAPSTVPALAGRPRLVRAVLVVLLVLSATLLVQLTIVSAVQHRAAQQRLFERFRAELAEGTAPTGPIGLDGRELALGAPVAYLEIPSIGLRKVVVEGTTSGALFAGPGHRRDSPLPGQVGTSVIAGRRSAFGGPFARIQDLEPGAAVRVTTAQGTFDHRVERVRREGDPLPSPLAPGASRLVLATADGRPLLPDGVLRVDVALGSDAVGGPARIRTAGGLDASEHAMAGDIRGLWSLALWLQALVALTTAAVWSWHRWGQAQTLVVAAPVFLLIGLAVSNQVARLLPNLL